MKHEEGDFLIEVTRNEPDKVIAAVEKMLREFDEAKLTTWLEELNGY